MAADLTEAQRDQLVVALRRERDGYLRYGRQDRAEEVAAELKLLGAPVDEQQAKPAARRGRTRARSGKGS